MPRHREEVLNTTFAACIVARGMSADPETILRHGTARPDVIVRFRGLRCAIEGKIGDSPAARNAAIEQAKGRIAQGIAHLAVAVAYPSELRTVEFTELAAAMTAATVSFAVFTDAGDGVWHSGGIDELLQELRRAHEAIVRDDVLAQAVATLSNGLDEVAAALLENRGTCERLIGLLGIGGKADGAHV